MGTKRLVALLIVVLSLVLAGFILPLNTTANVIDININIVVLFRALIPFFSIGLLLEVVSVYGRRLIPGKPGEAVSRLAGTYVPAFAYMVPVEVAYIILFVATTIHIGLIWNTGLFPYFFLPVPLSLPFFFTGRSLWASFKSTYNWLRPQYRKSVDHLKSSHVPWKPLFFDTVHDYALAFFGVVVGILVANAVDSALVQGLGIWTWVGIVLFFLVLYLLKYFKWRFSYPPRNP